MTRTDTLKKIDTVVKVCTTCKIKQNSSWKSVEYNRLQSYCNHKCKTGKQLQVLAVELDKATKERRKQKGAKSA